MLDVFKIGADFSPKYFASEYIPGRVGEKWFGTLRKQLGVRGKPDANGLARLLTARLKRRVGGRGGLIAGVHLTFSPPKGVSLAALVAQDTRVVLAHERAVDATLRYMGRLATCRVMRDGVMRDEKTSDLMMLVCHRTNSRADDPHLHSLISVFNGADVGDGVVRALNLKFFVADKLLLGAAYRAELRQGLAQIGYTFRELGNGLWDLETASPELIDLFSYRRTKIVKAVLEQTGKEPKDLSPEGLRQFVEITGRRNDDPEGYQALFAAWKRRVDQAGLALPTLPPHNGRGAGNRGQRSIATLVTALHDAFRQIRKEVQDGVPMRHLFRRLSEAGLAFDIADFERAMRIFCNESQYVLKGPQYMLYEKEKRIRRKRNSATPSTSAHEKKASSHTVKRDAFVRVKLHPSELREAKRHLVHRGYVTFGDFLEGTFGGALPPSQMGAASTEVTASRMARRLTLHSRVPSAVLKTIQAWGGGNYTKALRNMMCSSRGR